MGETKSTTKGSHNFFWRHSKSRPGPRTLLRIVVMYPCVHLSKHRDPNKQRAADGSGRATKSRAATRNQPQSTRKFVCIPGSRPVVECFSFAEKHVRTPKTAFFWIFSTRAAGIFFHFSRQKRNTLVFPLFFKTKMGPIPTRRT